MLLWRDTKTRQFHLKSEVHDEHLDVQRSGDNGGIAKMYSYSVKFICGVQNAPTKGQRCTSVRQGSYATEINIHNFHRDEVAKIEKRAILLIHNDSPVGLEPHVVRAQPFAEVDLPPQSATMDNCCGFADKLKIDPGRLTLGFLEFVSVVELVVVALYTATDLNSGSISIQVETISGRRL
jgi:hypothetical protein